MSALPSVRLAGRTILVTGATQGMGEGIARACAEAGATAIGLTGRDAARGSAVAAELRAMGARTHFAAGDLADEADCRRIVAETEPHQPFGRLIRPRDVAGLAVYLLSDAAEMMTGALIDFDQNVMGGYE